jgi:rSAM/selenodomain-associated transferase 2
MLNEERAIAMTLKAIRRGAPAAEIIAVDGSSSDQTVAIARSLADRVITSARGRACQMNAGAQVATSPDGLVFVHADTIVPTDFARQIETALQDASVGGGRFDITLDAGAWRYRMLAKMINIRSRLMRSATGDQAIFVRREIFTRLGGFPEIALCEDIELVRRLRRAGRMACLRATVLTSARRWREHGFVRTVLRMWTIKTLFLLGVSPDRLSHCYRDAR